MCNEERITVEFKEEVSELRSRNGTVFNIDKRGKLYYLNSVVTTKEASHNLQEWHEIMGHCNAKDVLNLEKVVTGMNITDKDMKACEVCFQGKKKMVEERCRIPDSRATEPLEFVHCDLAGPIEPAAKEGFRYALVFADDSSGVTMLYFLKNKSDTPQATKTFLADIAPYGRVKRLRSDRGGEFTSKEFKKLLVDHEIKHEMSAPMSPHQNGNAERQWRTLFEMGRCMLLENDLPKFLWAYAVMAASYTRNRCFNKRLGMTPVEAFTGIRPNISHMHEFGSKCFSHVNKKTKLDPRSEQGVFVGYDKSSPAYLVYFPTNRVVKRSRCVWFVNDKSRMCESETVDYPVARDVRSEQSDEGEPVVDEAVGKHDVAEETKERYPKRVTSKPKWFEDYVEKVQDTHVYIDYCYNVAHVPNNFGEAVACSEGEAWREAMNSEMESLVDNNVFELSKLPEGKSLVGGRWVFASKFDADGNLKHKARYVAKGYSQKENIDYFETFSPTVNMTSVRMLIQTAVNENMLVHQMDVKTAYLNAPIDCELYVKQPEGYKV